MWVVQLCQEQGEKKKELYTKWTWTCHSSLHSCQLQVHINSTDGVCHGGNTQGESNQINTLPFQKGVVWRTSKRWLKGWRQQATSVSKLWLKNDIRYSWLLSKYTLCVKRYETMWRRWFAGGELLITATPGTESMLKKNVLLCMCFFFFFFFLNLIQKPALDK